VTAQIQSLLANSAGDLVSGCSNGTKSSCEINGQSGLGEQLTALDSVVALLVGRPADADPTDSSVTSSGGAQPSATKTSAAPRIVKSNWQGLFTLALLLSFWTAFQLNSATL
jgi:hypothetical protein